MLASWPAHGQWGLAVQAPSDQALSLEQEKNRENRVDFFSVLSVSSCWIDLILEQRETEETQ